MIKYLSNCMLFLQFTFLFECTFVFTFFNYSTKSLFSEDSDEDGPEIVTIKKRQNGVVNTRGEHF